MNNAIDCTLDITELAAAIAPKLGTASVAVLHNPWDSEIGILYLDHPRTQLTNIDETDILVTVTRQWGELNSAWAARIAQAFENSI